jgi:RNA polymerase sigma factor (TIGR02999 family)
MEGRPTAGTITVLLTKLNDRALSTEQREQVEGRFMELVYPVLRKKAEAAMRRERIGHTLLPMGVVNEVYLELFGGAPITWQDRQHFFNLVSTKIRHVLAGHARERQRLKRGGAMMRSTLNTAAAWIRPEVDKSDLTLIVESVLEQLATQEPKDPLGVKVGELHFYAGFTLPETAELLDVSLSTVEKKKKKVRDLILEQCVKDGLQYGEKRSSRPSAGA